MRMRTAEMVEARCWMIGENADIKRPGRDGSDEISDVSMEGTLFVFLPPHLLEQRPHTKEIRMDSSCSEAEKWFGVRDWRISCGVMETVQRIPG